MDGFTFEGAKVSSELIMEYLSGYVLSVKKVLLKVEVGRVKEKNGVVETLDCRAL